MSTQVVNLLQDVQADQKTKADAWEVFHGIQDRKEFESRLASLKLPNPTKAKLWEMKFGAGVETGNTLTVPVQPMGGFSMGEPPRPPKGSSFDPLVRGIITPKNADTARRVISKVAGAGGGPIVEAGVEKVIGAPSKYIESDLAGLYQKYDALRTKLESGKVTGADQEKLRQEFQDLDMRVRNIEGGAETLSAFTSPLSIATAGAGKLVKGVKALALAFPFLLQGVSAATKPRQTGESEADLLERRLGGTGQALMSVPGVVEGVKGAPGLIEGAANKTAKFASGQAGVTPEKVAETRTKAQVAADKDITAIQAKREAQTGKLLDTGRTKVLLNQEEGALKKGVEAEKAALQQKHDILTSTVAEVQKKYGPEKMQEVRELKGQAETVQTAIKDAVATKRGEFREAYGKLSEAIGDAEVPAFHQEAQAIIEKYNLKPGEVPPALKWAAEVPERIGLEDASVFANQGSDMVTEMLHSARSPAEKTATMRGLVEQGLLSQDDAIAYIKGRKVSPVGAGPQPGLTIPEAQHIKTALGRTMQKRGTISNEEYAATAEAYDLLNNRMQETVRAADPDGSKGYADAYKDLSARYAKFAEDFYHRSSPLRNIDWAKDTAKILNPFMGNSSARAMEILRRNGIDRSVLEALPPRHEISRMIELEGELARIGEQRTAQAGIESKLKPEVRAAAARPPAPGSKEQALPAKLAKLAREHHINEVNREEIEDGLRKLDKEMNEVRIPSDVNIRAKLIDEFLNEKKSLFHIYAGMSKSGKPWAGAGINTEQFKQWLAQKALKWPGIRARAEKGINLGEPPKP